MKVSEDAGMEIKLFYSRSSHYISGQLSGFGQANSPFRAMVSLDI